MSDLFLRSVFWRGFLAGGGAIDAAERAALLANIAAMSGAAEPVPVEPMPLFPAAPDDAADPDETPPGGNIVRLVPRIAPIAEPIAEPVPVSDRSDPIVEHPAPIAAPVKKPARVAKPARLTTLEFWSHYDRACAAIIAAHGPRWAVTVPGETVLCDLPARYRSHTTERGTRIRWNRDRRMPAACYWPGSVLPAGIEAISGAVSFERPWPGDEPIFARIRAAVAEQIADDNALRPSSPRMMPAGRTA